MSDNTEQTGSTSTSSTTKPSSSGLSGLLVRAASGLIYAGIFIMCLIIHPVTTALCLAVISMISCREFFDMMRRDGKMPHGIIGTCVAALFPIAALGGSLYITATMFALVLAVGLWYVWSPRTRIMDVSVTLMGPIYTGFMLSAIVLLRDLLPGVPGALLAVGACASLWVSDSFAYLVGSRFGKHKMVPKISPNKSWEGFAGGVVGSILIWLILFATGLFTFSWQFAVVCGAVVSVLGVFGDLIESRIKRGAGVKDSGNLIPGHGGMLDRNDSLIFGGITALLMLMFGGIL